MKYKWQEWCRLCGNPGFTTKFEYSLEILNFFKISPVSHKICSSCSTYLSQFQDFVTKSQNLNAFFSELSLENDLLLDIERINEIRTKYALEPLNIDAEVKALPFEPVLVLEDPIKNIDVKLKTEIEVEPEISQTFQDKMLIKEKPAPKRKKLPSRQKKRRRNSSDSEDFDDSDDLDYKKTGTIQENKFNVNQSKEIKEKRRQRVELQTKEIPAPKRKKFPSRQKKRESNLRESSSDSENFDDLDDLDYKERKPIQRSQNEFNVSQSKEAKEKRRQIMELQTAILPLICHVCEKNFNDKGVPELAKHCKEVHNTHMDVPCICGVSLKNSCSIAKHRKKCIRKSSDLYRCDLCGNDYKFKKQLEIHIQSKHKGGAAKLVCSYCAKEFRLKHHLKNHEITHIPHELRELKFECKLCQKRFQLNGRLQNHMRRVHSDEKNHICHICSKGFKMAYGLKMHIDSFHATSANFECTEPGCNMKCRSKNLLRAHMESHAPKTIPCPHCPKMFARNFLLKNHVYYSHTHADLRPFKCDQCELTFKRKTDVKRHALTHGPSDQFTCFLGCDSTFKKTATRNTHFRQYHPNEYREYILQKEQETLRLSTGTKLAPGTTYAKKKDYPRKKKIDNSPPFSQSFKFQ